MSTPPSPSGVDPIAWKAICDELKQIALDADPEEAELQSLIAFAGAPLIVPDGPSPRQLQARRVGRSERHLLELSRLEVPEAVIESIRQHAASAAPGHEVVGRLVCHNRAGQRYEPLTNLSTEAGRFSTRATWKPGPGEYGLIVHSHPPGASASPSNADFAYAKKRGWPVIGIWHQDNDRLCIFRLLDDAFIRIPLEVVTERKPDPALGPRRRAATITASGRRR